MFEENLLTQAQSNALKHVHQQALLKTPVYRATLSSLLIEEHNPAVVDTVLEWVRKNAYITVNFHPDRYGKDRRTVIQALLDDGMYKSQFSTGISNGGLTAFPGGDRDRWEEKMFGRAYHQPATETEQEKETEKQKEIEKEKEKEREREREEERPKYGGLNLFNYSDGACPRFGSCHLRLKSHVVNSSTFSFGDSVSEPEHMGLMSSFSSVLCALVQHMSDHSRALGTPMSILSFLNLISGKEKNIKRPGRAIDDYIEAQIHSNIYLSKDVEAIVADPSFKGTEIESKLQLLSEKYKISLEWNTGYYLKVENIPDNIRGPQMPLLASRISNLFNEKVITPALLGKAAQSVVLDPEQWKDWDTEKETLQGIKYLWHILVICGISDV